VSATMVKLELDLRDAHAVWVVGAASFKIARGCSREGLQRAALDGPSCARGRAAQVTAGAQECGEGAAAEGQESDGGAEG